MNNELPLKDRGVTPSCLIDLVWGVNNKQNKGNTPLGMTCRKAVECLIIDGGFSCSFVEYLNTLDKDGLCSLLDNERHYVCERSLLNKPEYFVSHPWDGMFRDLMYLSQYLLGSGGTVSNTAFWIDIFAINQHDPNEDLSNIDKVIKSCNHTLLVLDENGEALSRLWCVYEIWVSLKENIQFDIIFAGPNGFYRVLYALCVMAGRFSTLDIRSCRATKGHDKDAIMNRIRESNTDVDTINDQLRNGLIKAAEYEVLEMASVPASVVNESVKLINSLGWPKVLENGTAERAEVNNILSGHIKYGNKKAKMK